MIKQDELEKIQDKYKNLEWKYVDFSFKKRSLLYNINSKTSFEIIFKEPNIFNKYYLHDIVKNNNKKIYNKYFVNQQIGRAHV